MAQFNSITVSLWPDQRWPKVTVIRAIDPSFKFDRFMFEWLDGPRPGQSEEEGGYYTYQDAIQRLTGAQMEPAYAKEVLDRLVRGEDTDGW